MTLAEEGSGVRIFIGSENKLFSLSGSSLIVAPWGEVLADGGSKPGVTLTDIDLDEVAKARARVPSLSHDRPFEVSG